MLYTSMPLERIYSNQVNSLIVPRNLNNQVQYQNPISIHDDSIDETMKMIQLTHGRVYARKEGKGYVVHSLQSTNLEDYLSVEYNIGNEIRVE